MNTASSTRRAATSPRRARRTAGARGGADPRRGFFRGYLKDEARPRRPGRAAGSTPATSCARDADGMLLFRRPQEEHHPPLGREHRGARGRKRAAPASAVKAVAVRRDAGRDARRGGLRLRRRATATPTAGETGALAQRSSRMRSSGSPITRRRATSPSWSAAADRDAEDPARRDQGAGRTTALPGRRTASTPAR